MIGAAMREPAGESGTRGRVVYGLRGVPPEKLAAHLEPYFAKHESEPDKALVAYVLYCEAAKKEPPGAERLDNARDIHRVIMQRYARVPAQPVAAP